MSNSENAPESRHSLSCQIICMVFGHDRQKMLIIPDDGVFVRLDFPVHCPLLSKFRKAA